MDHIIVPGAIRYVLQDNLDMTNQKLTIYLLVLPAYSFFTLLWYD